MGNSCGAVSTDVSKPEKVKPAKKGGIIDKKRQEKDEVVWMSFDGLNACTGREDRVD